MGCGIFRETSRKGSLTSFTGRLDRTARLRTCATATLSKHSIIFGKALSDASLAQTWHLKGFHHPIGYRDGLGNNPRHSDASG